MYSQSLYIYKKYVLIDIESSSSGIHIIAIDLITESSGFQILSE